MTVSATPEDGHVFLYWQGDRSSNSNPYSFRVYNDTNLQAVFEKIEADKPGTTCATSFLRRNFTDSDGDGMTDVAEIKEGAQPTRPGKFPSRGFIASLPTEYPIQNSTLIMPASLK